MDQGLDSKSSLSNRNPMPFGADSVAVTTPNELMRGLHDRMPVLLQGKDWDAWLDDGDDGTPIDVVQSLMRPAPDGLLTARAISTRVNNPRNDDAAVLQ